jgi:membrane associated rhomboid family serine protease
MVGASGAISGVLGAYMLLYPHARVLLGLPLGFYIVQLGRFPAGWVLALWFLMQFVSNLLTSPEVQGGVAFRAHIGGFIAGMVLIAFFKRREVRFWQPPRSRGL